MVSAGPVTSSVGAITAVKTAGGMASNAALLRPSKLSRPAMASPVARNA
jgi:hypothetical protein